MGQIYAWITTILPVLVLVIFSAATIGVVSLPTSCGRTFCERANGYPITPSVQQNMANDPRFSSLKGVPVQKTTSNTGEDDPDVLSDDVMYQICKSKADIIFPQEAQNTRGQRKFIINFGPFVQGIAIERCMTDSFNLPCNFVGSPPGYQSVCVQKEMEHRLTTIESDPVTGSVSTSVDIFRFPSYCACKLITGQRTAALCASQQQLAPPGSPPAAVYGLGASGAYDDPSTGPDTKSLKITSRNRLTYPTTVTRAALNTRTLDLFVPSSRGGQFNGGNPTLWSN